MAIKSATRSTLENNIFYRSMLAGNESIILEDEYLLEEQILTSSAASVTFSGLDAYAGVYQHLQIRINGRSGNANLWSQYRIRFNGDAGSNYDRHYLIGSGSSVISGAFNNQNGYIDGQTQTGNSAVANAFGGAILDLLDAFSSTKNTTIRNFGGRIPVGDDPVMLGSGLWRNTASLTSIEILNDANWLTGSRFSLYGAK